MTPAKFEKHGGRGVSKKWKDTIWVAFGGQKVMFSKVKGLDAFIRRYKESLEADEKVSEIQNDECVSKRHLELENYLESLNQTPRDKQEQTKSIFQHGDKSSINQFDAHGFKEEIGDATKLLMKPLITELKAMETLI